MADNEKVLRILLAEEQIRRIDALILSGVGGFPTRNQFLREAAEMLLAEYTYGSAPPPRHPLFTYETLAPEASEAALRAWRVTDLDGTVLRRRLADIRSSMKVRRLDVRRCSACITGTTRRSGQPFGSQS